MMYLCPMEILSAQEQKKIQQKSMGITLLIGLSLLVFSFVFTFVETTIPPLFEILSEGSGSVDFGNWTEGSGNVNNFENPSPKASEGSASQNQSSNASSQSSAEQNLTDETQEDETIQAPPPKDKKKNKDKQQSTTHTQQQNQNTQNTTDNSDKTKNTHQQGGSNHGDGNQVGNRGRDDVKILDPDGLYSFGSGEDGLMGRKPISLAKPIYDVEAEAKIIYEFTIAPDGSVKNVKALTLSPHVELKNAGMKAIYKWKFEPIESGKFQKTKVTITFKLK